VLPWLYNAEMSTAISLRALV